MTSARTDRLVIRALAWALVAAPSLLLLVGLLHFRHGRPFFHFEARYVAPPASTYVSALIAGGNRAPLLHDPHMLAYLGLPLLLFGAFGLYALGRERRPLASVGALAVSLVGMVYVGGLFGTWTALFRGFGDVEPRYLEGATAAWAALTAPRGALLVTTSLAKLAMIGPALQALCLLELRRTDRAQLGATIDASSVPRWAPLMAAAGYLLIVAFWDLDNWMMLGEALVLVAMLPMRARLAARATAEV